MPPPFTGNGFTSAINGQVIPEFRCGTYLNIYDGAELYKVGKDGTEILQAVFDSDIGRFETDDFGLMNSESGKAVADATNEFLKWYY